MGNYRTFSQVSDILRRQSVFLGLLLGLVLITLIILTLGVKLEDGRPKVAAPTWRGIIPGRTTESEVRAILGKPDAINICPTWSNLWNAPSFHGVLNCFAPPWTYEYTEVRIAGHLPAKHEIRFRLVKVLAIVEDLSDSPNESSPTLLRRLIKDYGPPERVTWASRFPEFFRAFLFCEHGTIVLGDETKAGKLFYFVPMPLKECLSEFESDVATEDPFPNPQFPRKENPWPWLIDDK